MLQLIKTERHNRLTLETVLAEGSYQHLVNTGESYINRFPQLIDQQKPGTVDNWLYTLSIVETNKVDFALRGTT